MAEKYNYDDDKIIFGTSDNDRIFNGNEVLYGSTTAYKTGGDRVTIQSMAGNDYIYNYSNHTEINSGTSDDTIENHGFKVNIVTSEGNDSVLSGGNDVTISTGSGNDTIYNITGYNASINAGAGDDVITNGDYILHYDNVTIMAGCGNDKINLSEESSLYNVLQYVDGDGNDTVYGYNFNDTIQIINGLYTTTTSGNDVIINVGNGKITLKNAKDKQLNITTITMNIDDTSDKDNNRQESLKIPSDAFIYNGHSYYIYQNVVNTWEEAQMYCQSFGGHLAIINDSAENTELFNYMKNKGYDSAYFGLSDAVKEGNWIWVDGTPVNYTNWADGEPNNEGGNENYGMFYWKFTDGKWNDGIAQKDSAPFICEWDTVRQDDNIEIDEATALEVINLFKGMDAAEKKTTLKENLATLESLKTIVEGDKKIEIKDEETGNSYFTDSKNLIETFKACYDDDAPEWLTEYTKYVHDFKGHIVYKSYYLKYQDGHFIYDSEGNPIRFFELDANNNRIPVEYNSKLRDAASNTLGITFDIYSASESIEKLLYEDLNSVQKQLKFQS